MEQLRKQQERAFEGCVSMADAMLDALAKGNVTHVKGIGGEGQLPNHVTIDGIKIPIDGRGQQKIWAASALMLMAVNHQLDPETSRFKAGFKIQDTDMCCWVDEFDYSKIRVNEAKAYIRKQLKSIFAEISDPIKAFDDSLRATHTIIQRNAPNAEVIPMHKDSETYVPDPDAYWVGPFNKQKMRYAEAIMQVLLTFHGIEHIYNQDVDMHDGTIAIKLRASEVKPLFEKEGIISDKMLRP
jgi:hypothetical protein